MIMSSRKPAVSPTIRAWWLALTIIVTSFQLAFASPPQSPGRTISGTVVDDKGQVLTGVAVVASGVNGERRTTTNATGQFTLETPYQDVSLRIEGAYIKPLEQVLSADTVSENLRIQVEYRIPPIHQSLVITASALEPQVETHSDEVYKRSLFSRDDQLLETLNAGINAGQHEGGGKSLEIRRFGFNLDHGGVNGGLKVLVDDVQQNQGTQGHGQGYLGALKTLTPELIQDVNILNGPFSAEYGDFSGLGVVHIRLKESLPDQFTAVLQGGSFGSARTFFGYSPSLQKADAFLAYEGSSTDGPFNIPLRYKRDNITGNYTRQLANGEAIGVKLNFGRNDFFSSGQIPLDQVAAGELSRFGYIDPSDGGRVRLGTAGVYYRKTLKSGDSFKADGFLSRSLFDLYSNFTFFLNDPVHGDGIQQHDSRYQQGFNTQYLHLYRLWGNSALLTAGTNFHDNQINVGLYPQQNRVPLDVATRAYAHVTNGAGYAQQGVDFLHGRLHIDGGLRWDYFRFAVDDRVAFSQSGNEGASRLQPKFALAYRVSNTVPITVSINYGRGINTQDARGIVQRPDSPRIATTDFYQVGTAYQMGRVSVTGDLVLIDRSNEQVYIPDDGTFELKGPSRSYGYEGKTSIHLTRYLSLNGGLTQVTNSFYRNTSPRIYVDSAPHTVANGGLTLSGWRGLYGSLRYRHIGNYRLHGEDPAIRASGLDVLDLAITKPIRPWLDLNFNIDNLTDKVYYETQNYFESRITPDAPAIERIHGTPGYPIGFTVGLTFRLGENR
jgi:TonB dependent receptor/Carboxypeptidase regulatory-like domain/TonB-dependent Receptor Plug Domain